MSLMTLLRRWGPAAVLALTSVASWQAAQSRDTEDVAAEPVGYEQTLATPMLSARRIPETLQAPVADATLGPPIEALAAELPPASCVLVRVRDRVIEPQPNADIGLVPASNQKVISTYAALLGLGPSFRFRTTVASEIEPVDGVLEGDLYFIGSGDPFLSTDNWWSQFQSESLGRHHTRLEDLADAIQETGITTITGAIVGDESLLDSQRTGPWAERLINQKQSGPLSALTVNEGFVDWPSQYAAASLRTATDDPPLHAAGALAQLLADRGITVGGTASGTAPAGASVIAEVESPELVDLVTHINSYSSNMGAELVLKRLGLEIMGEGSTEAGAQAARMLLANEGLAVTDEVVIVDGSGLSEDNRLTCRLLVDVLAAAEPTSDLAESMAIGGVRGTLRSRYVDSPAAGNVLAKTGFLEGSSALSGYVNSVNDPDVTLVFATIANAELVNYDTMTGLQDPFVITLTSYPGSPSTAVLSPLPPLPN